VVVIPESLPDIVETDRAAATLSIWAASEGPDLSDVFSSSSILLRHLSSALQRFGEHEASIRSNYKTIRTKDEEFDELKKRRRAVGKNAEAAERKLQKMGPEVGGRPRALLMSKNKNLPSQTELLERLRDEMRQLDSEILTGEARLGDLKRRSVASLSSAGSDRSGCPNRQWPSSLEACSSSRRR
jgi:chromosome segregation ATPase